MQPETPPTPSPEQRALRILPYHWRPELAADGSGHLSSRSAGALRDAIAAAIRSAEAAADERARADEREACAKVADDAYNRYSAAIQNAPHANIPALAVKHSQGGQQAAGDIADAIRARSTTEGR